MYIEVCRHRVPNAWRHLTPEGEVQEAALRGPVELAKHSMKLRRGWKITAAMLGDDAALEQEHQAYAQRPQVEVLSCRIGEQLLFDDQMHLGGLNIRKQANFLPECTYSLQNRKLQCRRCVDRQHACQLVLRSIATREADLRLLLLLLGLIMPRTPRWRRLHCQ